MTVKKKRGRKPKGGKIVKMDKNIINEIVKENNIVLHLKCSSSDLKTQITTNTLNYSPDVVNNIESYQLYTNKKLNSFTFKNIDKKESKKKNGDICIIDEKLKNISTMLHDNEIPNKKSLCFWCTEKFNNSPIFIPKNKRGGFV
tara:strand:+ start:259 stop:690 length:432 start_codon:yes stop_codon:yes gene_type:complete